MEILKFIFVLGINFSIFGFIWGLIMLVVRMFQAPGQPRNQSVDYVLRIVKYFMMVSVTANYIVLVEGGESGVGPSSLHIVVGAIVLTLYLLGKLRNRAILQELGKNPMLARFSTSIDPKVELYLLIGSVSYFVACLLYPQMVDNNLVNWFTESIIGIYETPVIGWIFSVIAFFFLVNILMRAANVIGRILNGQSLFETRVKTNFRPHNDMFGGQSQNQSNENDGFSDYEDITDEDEKK
jgi:hypothetical protein